MDYTSALASAGVSTTSIVVLGILYKLWQTIKGHRLVSDCCGRQYEVGIDVRDMPPTPPTPGGNQTHLLSPPLEEESYQNPPSTDLAHSNNHLETKKHKRVHTHQLQPVVEEESSHESFALTISDTTPSDDKKENDSDISLPPI